MTRKEVIPIKFKIIVTSIGYGRGCYWEGTYRGLWSTGNLYFLI